MYWPRGRVWGGSSSLNAMVYIRGHAEDYNRWQREGAEGWDYEHCLPYFRKAQCHEQGENRYIFLSSECSEQTPNASLTRTQIKCLLINSKYIQRSSDAGN